MRCAVVILLLVSGAAFASEDPVFEKKSDGPSHEVMTAQIMLDRALFSPGEIDGIWGDNGIKALKAFQEAQGFEPSGKLTEETSSTLARESGTTEPLFTYRLTQADIDGPYLTSMPKEMADMATLPHAGYTSVTEMLGERFHADPQLLVWLNKDARWEVNEEIQVPAVDQTFVRAGKDLKEPKEDKDEKPKKADDKDTAAEPEIRESGLKEKPDGKISIIVSRKGGGLKVLNDQGKVIFFAPVTTGSEHDPLPLGEWKINGTERYPKYSYNPDLFWDAEKDDKKAKIPAGPNNPVGVAWIDISRPHYGLHGTPEPGKIGYSESHGCVRLTNWDALRLADMVGPGVRVVFEE